MRFPWLQVDADFLGAHAGDLGAHLGISRREAIGLALDLWTWALARAPDNVPPDGIITGTGAVPDRLLAGSVGWTGPTEQFTTALVAVGMAVRIDDGYRLTGFNRYRATWEKNRRRTGEKPDRYRTGTGEEPARKTQTYTQKEETTSPACAVAAGGQASHRQAALIPEADIPAKPRRTRAPDADGPDPRHRPLMRAMEAAYAECVRREDGTPDKWDLADGMAGREAKAVKALLAKADGDVRTAGDAAPAEVLRRWRNALADPFARVRYAHILADRWGNYSAPRNGGTPTMATSGRLEDLPPHILRRAETFTAAHIANGEGEQSIE